MCQGAAMTSLALPLVLAMTSRWSPLATEHG